MKLSWHRLVFFALLMFIIPYMIVYSTTKPESRRQVQPAAQPKVAEEPAVEEKAVSEMKQKTGPFMYVTGHNKEIYTMLYYPGRQSSVLVPVAKRISGYEPGLEEALSALLNRDYAPPGLNKTLFNPDTRLLNVGVKGNTVIVDFNEGLIAGNADGNVSPMIVRAIENVARQFPYDALEIRVNGKPLAATSAGIENGLVILNRRPTDSYIVYRPLVTEGLVYLYPEVIAGSAVPAQVVNDFLKLLSKDVADMYKEVYISPEVRLLSASAQNGQVTLNFNQALLDKFNTYAKQFSNRQMAENFFFDAVIFSLTDIPGVQEVIFLVEGKQVNSLKNPVAGDFSFARPKNINPVN